jgi:hypothetical protein
MTQAQKTAKEKFKKAIEYKNKTGCSLKEAFAHAYGRKVGAFRKAPVKKASPGKHTDTKSHNVNIKIVSGINAEYNIEGKKLKIKEAKTTSGVYYIINIDGADIEYIYPNYRQEEILNNVAPNISRYLINTSGYKSSKQMGEIKRRVIKLCNILLKQLKKENSKVKKAPAKKVAVKKPVTKKVARQTRSPRKVRATYKIDYQTGKENRTDRGNNQDAKRKALPPGKRVSDTGITYYETRANRTDLSRKAMTGIGNIGMYARISPIAYIYASKFLTKSTMGLRQWLQDNVGKFIEIDTSHLFNNQYNTKNGYRIYDTMIDAIKGDVRKKGKAYGVSSEPEDIAFLDWGGIKPQILPNIPDKKFGSYQFNSYPSLNYHRLYNARQTINFIYTNGKYYISSGIGYKVSNKITPTYLGGSIPAKVKTDLDKYLKQYYQ